MSGIAWGEVGIGCPGLLRPSCAADAMHIVLRVVGEVKVDHKPDIGHIWRERGREDYRNDYERERGKRSHPQHVPTIDQYSNLPRPRDATSVAIRIGDFPALNSARKGN